MIIQIFQHLPTLPKAGIFCPLPILCVAFRAFIPDRSVFRCSLSPVFLCSVPSSRCINPHTLLRTPPLPRTMLAHRTGHQTPAPRGSTPTPGAVQPATPPIRTHTPITPHIPTPAPTVPLPAQATGRQHQGQRTHIPRCTAYCFSKPHTPATQPPPPHTQASKKDCPAQEQSFL